MSENSSIEWCDHTYNWWEGCTKVSPGCANCYAESMNRRFRKGRNWGKGAPRRLNSDDYHKKAFNWDSAAAAIQQEWENKIKRRDEFVRDEHGSVCLATFSRLPEPQRPRIFCNSTSDWLDEEVPIEWLVGLLDTIRQCPNLDFLLLTKRPQLWLKRMAAALHFVEGWNIAEAAPDEVCDPKTELGEWLDLWTIGRHIPKNIWIGISVEDMPRAKERISSILSIPSKVKFLSVEPQLEHIQLAGLIDGLMIQNGEYAKSTRLSDDSPVPANIDWVICGGESGPGARPFNINWARDLRDQCVAAEIPFFMKQLGAKPYESDIADDSPGNFLSLLSPKGGEPEEWPEDLRLRSFPQPRTRLRA